MAYAAFVLVLFFCWRSPSFLKTSYAYLVIGGPIVTIVFAHFFVEIEKNKVNSLNWKKGDLKEALRDTEKVLTDHLDP